ncbi:MAG: anti-sigma factor [Opitutae bacterium]|nr:anti-sigma factor [Opitutae bacterium]
MPAAPDNAGGPPLREPAVETATVRPGAFRLRQIAPWAVAAVLAVAAAWFATRNLALRTENLTLRSERRLAEVAYRMARNQLAERSFLAEKMIAELGGQLRHSEDLTRLKVTALAAPAGHPNAARAIVVWDPGQQAGLLTVEQLPANADTQDYQIWLVDPAYPDPVNGGVFHAGADGRATLGFKPDHPVTQVAEFAISLGKKGGAPKAEGPMVLRGS